jgi:tetratricopeptide (TPR) repeat protein
MRKNLKVLLASELFLILSISLILKSTSAHCQDVRKNPQFQQALQQFRDSKYDESVLILEGLVYINPRAALYWFNLANAHFMLGNYPRAIAGYSKVIELKSPLSMAARLYIAKCHRKTAKFDLAYEIIKKLKDERFPNALGEEYVLERETLGQDLLEIGLEYYENEKIDQAINFLSKSLDLEFDPATSIIYGFALMKANKLEMAKDQFKTIVSDKSDTSASLQSDASYFLNQIERGIWEQEKPYWLYLEIAGGYDSNVFSDGGSESLTSKPVINFDLGTGARIFSKGDWGLRGAYNFSWQEFIDLSYLRLINNTVRAALFFDTSNWLIQLEPVFTHELLDFESFRFRIGGSLLVQKNIGDFKIGTNYEFYKILSSTTTYSYLDGNSHYSSIYCQYWGQTYMVGPYFIIYKESSGALPLSTGTLPLENLSYGPGIRIKISPEPLWKILFGTSFLVRNYSGLTSPDNLERNEKYWTTTIKFTRAINKDFEFFVQSDLRFNWSTIGSSSIDDKNYKALTVFGGLTWNALP